MESESARMSTSAEARFRIQAQPDTNRAVKVIDLDSAIDRDIKRLIAEIDGADLVLMLVSAGGNAAAAAVIGEACSASRVMTHAVITRAAAATDAAPAANARPFFMDIPPSTRQAVLPLRFRSRFESPAQLPFHALEDPSNCGQVAARSVNIRVI